MAAVELSDSTAIFILASIAGVYFSITAACSVVICRLLFKRQCTSSDLPPKFPGARKNEYELTGMRGVTRGIRDGSDLVPGVRAGRWRQYMSSNQPATSDGTSQHHNGNHKNGYTQEHSKLPAIEEVGAGGEEEEEEEAEVTATQTEETAPRDSSTRSQWRAKRKVRGRTSSTKFLLEERDGSSWTLTSTNGANGVSILDDVMSSLDLTASLPGPVLAQSDSHPLPVPIPRPVPGGSRIPGHDTRSESPVILQTNSSGSGRSVGQRRTVESELVARESPPDSNQPRVRRAHKQLSLSTHSLPRHSTASTTRPLETQISAGSGTLPQSDAATNGGSRPRLRRYASTASYCSTTSQDPVVLVRPRSRSGSRRGSYYLSNTLERGSFEQGQYCSATSVEMEGNYYTLQTRRGAGGEAGEEGRSGLTLPVKESSSKEDVIAGEGVPEECRPITFRIGEKHVPTVIDLGYEGLESTV